MSRNRLSSGGGWTDAEKLKVIFSLLEANGKIEYSKAYVPPGRTIKAVHHMIQNEKKRMESLSAADDGETTTSNEGSSPAETPSKPAKTPRTPKAAKAKAGNEPAKTGVKRKRPVKEEETEDKPLASKDESDLKKLKKELESALGESEALRKTNGSGFLYDGEA